jgi:hypothetical protein
MLFRLIHSFIRKLAEGKQRRQGLRFLLPHSATQQYLLAVRVTTSIIGNHTASHASIVRSVCFSAKVDVHATQKTGAFCARFRRYCVHICLLPSFLLSWVVPFLSHSPTHQQHASHLASPFSLGLPSCPGHASRSWLLALS